MGNKIYLVMTVVACGIFALQKSGIYLPGILNNYANDLLCLPLVLGFITFVIRQLKKDTDFQLPLFFVVLMALYYSIYFECYLPIHNPRYTADWIDALLYFVGAFAFYGYQRVTFLRSTVHQD